MDIQIHSIHFELGEEQKELIEAKIAKLENLASRLSDESAEAKLDISLEQSRKSSDTFAAHLTIFVPQDTLRAEARDESLENVIDDVISKIKGQIEHYKAKSQNLN